MLNFGASKPRVGGPPPGSAPESRSVFFVKKDVVGAC